MSEERSATYRVKDVGFYSSPFFRRLKAALPADRLTTALVLCDWVILRGGRLGATPNPGLGDFGMTFRVADIHGLVSAVSAAGLFRFDEATGWLWLPSGVRWQNVSWLAKGGTPSWSSKATGPNAITGAVSQWQGLWREIDALLASDFPFKVEFVQHNAEGLFLQEAACRYESINAAIHAAFTFSHSMPHRIGPSSPAFNGASGAASSEPFNATSNAALSAASDATSDAPSNSPFNGTIEHSMGPLDAASNGAESVHSMAHPMSHSMAHPMAHPMGSPGDRRQETGDNKNTGPAQADGQAHAHVAPAMPTAPRREVDPSKYDRAMKYWLEERIDERVRILVGGSVAEMHHELEAHYDALRTAAAAVVDAYRETMRKEGLNDAARLTGKSLQTAVMRALMALSEDGEMPVTDAAERLSLHVEWYATMNPKRRGKDGKDWLSDPVAVFGGKESAQSAAGNSRGVHDVMRAHLSESASWLAERHRQAELEAQYAAEAAADDLPW